MGVVVVVDDERTFEFKEGTTGYTFRTSAEALKFLIGHWYELYSDPIEALYLDYDLGGNDTALIIARFMQRVAQLKFPWDTESVPMVRVERVFVHSQNPVGARDMRSLLMNHYDVRIIKLPTKV